jgi:hypothetical protein
MAGRWETTPGGPWRVILYVDDRASAAQKDALAAVPVFLTVQTREAVSHDFTVSCGIPGHDHPGQEIRAEIFRYEDTPFDWDIRGKCGFATDFAYCS